MNTVVSGAPADPIRRFTLTITMDGTNSDALLRLVSVFHRRQIEILQTTYERVASTGWMVATVQATDARVRTTALTLRNTIGVTGCEVTPDAPTADRVRTPVVHELA